MSVIITITFNPALDKSVSVEEMLPEKKLKCALPVYEPGGGGINVARAIRKLGGEATAVYLAGGYAGTQITKLLKEDQIESLVIPIQGITRENLVVLDHASNKQYLFDMQGPQISQNEWEKCLYTVEELPDVKYIVASGSLPSGVPVDIFAKLALIAKKKNSKLIVDTSGEALKHAINAGVYLIKPNLKELCSLVDREELTRDQAVEVAGEIIAMGGCEVVVVSMGALGAVLVTKNGALDIIQPEVKINSTVGAGDSMVAGIVLSLADNRQLEEAVQYGVACGISATMSTGTELCERDNAAYLYNIIGNNAEVMI